MAKLTLVDGTIIEGTPQELYVISQKFGVKADEPAKEITYNGVEYTLVNRKAQEGDVVIPTAKSTSSYALVGEVYPVVKRGGELKIETRDDWYYDVYTKGYNRTTETVLVYAPKVEALKVGDYAKVITKVNEHKVGDIVKITEINNGYYDFKVDRVGYGAYGYIFAKDIEKISVEDGCKLEEQSAKDAIFTQAGRKPNEYRKGDIIGYDSIQYGRVVIKEVTDIVGNRIVYFSEGFGDDDVSKDSDRLTLIATVESRLDLRN